MDNASENTTVIKYLIDLFKHFTPVVQIVLIILVGGFLFIGYNFVMNKEFRESVIKSVSKLFKRLSAEDNLSSHDLFFNKPYYTRLINNVDFYNNILKTELFKILLTEKINIAIEITKVWLKNLNYNKHISNELLIELMFDNITKIVQTYEAKILERYITKLGEEKGKKAFDLIYCRYKTGFKAIHNENIDFIQRNILKISKSKSFSLTQKIYSYLTQIDIALEIAITDCEESFELLNGELNNL